MPSENEPQIVGIGTSAGGVKALQAFFEAMPVRNDAAFVVVMHLDPEFRSEMAGILAARTEMPVMQVEDSPELKGGCVYVIPPNRELRIGDHVVSAVPFDEPRGKRAPIDHFFQSLADQHGDAFAVVLTGAGGDGAHGVKAIKEAGGIVLVQDPNEAEYTSMPRSAIATEVADFVLPIRDLVARIVELLDKRVLVAPDLISENQDAIVGRILAHVRARTGHDFSQYKRATVLRRIARRAHVSRHDFLVDYYSYLRDNVEEVKALFADFLISVTSFFRDRDAFDFLAKAVIPRLFDNKESADSIRVWVPGCATGEEAYTLGILLLEEAARREIRPEIQVFGSDLDEGALAVAREGRYPQVVEADLSDERLRRFFVREGEHYRVRRELRDVCLFATHSLLKDPPFSRLDLISCRNLMIYLDRDLQRQVSAMFHYALCPRGFLFLGSSEAADSPPGLFHPLDRDHRVFQSMADATTRRAVLPPLLGGHSPGRGFISTRVPTPPVVQPADGPLHRHLLEQTAPPSILVDEEQHAIHLSESAGRFLQPSAGPVSTNIVDLVREEIRFELRLALHRAFERNKPILSHPISVNIDGEERRVLVQARPVRQGGDGARSALVLFIEGEPVEIEPAEDTIDEASTNRAGDVIRQLQEELRQAQIRLRETREESESATEEWRAANEELQSINEEYRSTSEELETSKEELQSINEELQTVNNELKMKLEGVSRAHSDLQNLMAAMDFGTLFLDPELRIKRFTPRLTDLFNVTSNDEGRPITNFTHELEYENMAEEARAILDDLVPIEREVRGRRGGWYLVRMRPYRTIEDKIDGVVLTFVDITERRRVEEALRRSEEKLRQEMRLVELSRSPIFVWEFNDGIVQWNRGSEELYGYTRDEALGHGKEDLLQSIIPGSSYEILREKLLEAGEWAGEMIQVAKDGRTVTVESHIELITVGGRELVLESTRDISDRKRWEKRQQLLLGELTHRVKNTLTVVQSMARQTLRTARSSEEFVERFEGRLTALARSHKLLVDSYWQGAELRALVESQLDAHSVGAPARVRIEGDPVTLPADLATPFGLVLHELATNAIKYGSLSVEKGSVDLSWTVIGGNGEARLRVVWKERDGPEVAAPDHSGFGKVLIEKGIPDAEVHHEFPASGVVCTIEFPLPKAGEDGTTD